MKAPAIPPDEAQRLAALRQSALLDTPPEERFDRLTRLARQIFQVPIALVSLVDRDRQWFKSCQGLEASETGRDISFCGHVILEMEIMEVPDATLDPRFADNPLVSGSPGIRFYAGVPLRSVEGYRIGTFCIIDTQPRELSSSELLMLKDLARCAEEVLLQQHQNRRYQMMETLMQTVSRSVAEPEVVLQQILELGCQFFELPCAILSIYHTPGWSELLIQRAAAAGFPEGFTTSGYQVLVECLQSESQPLGVLALTESAWQARAICKDWHCQTLLGMNLLWEQQPQGALAFFSFESGRVLPFSDQDFQMLQLLASLSTKFLYRWRLDQALKQYQQLNQTLTRSQFKLLQQQGRAENFNQLLEDILKITGSQQGFIGEVLYTAEAQPYLKTYAISGFAHNVEALQHFPGAETEGIEFRNLDNLLGKVMLSGQVLIANQLDQEAMRSKLPAWHPVLDNFLGIPIFFNQRMIAMIGLANRPQGYEQALVDFLDPLLTSIGQWVEAFRIRERQLESERRLEESKQQLDLVINSTGVGIWDWEIPSGQLSLNARWAEIIGYTLAELEPISIQTWLTHAHPDDLEDSNRRLASCWRGETPLYIFEGRMRHRNGDWIWILDTGKVVEWLPDGRPLRMVGTHLDMTAHKHHEMMLREQALHTQTILDTIQEGILTLDRNGRICGTNQAVETLFGHAYEDMIQKPLTFLMPELTSLSGETLQALTGVTREGQGQRSNGSLFQLEFCLSPITRRGEVLYVATLRDITERKRVERLQNEFVSMVSHELRTPLTSISGALGVIEGGILGELPAEMQQMIEISQRNSRRLTLLINDLLDIEKISAGKMQFRFGRQSLKLLLEQALEANRVYCERRGVHLTLSTEIPELYIWVDPQRLMQVLNNLLSNAIKYSPEQGVVQILVESDQEQVCVWVVDQGPGIPAEFHAHVFEKFAMADASDARQQEGTGLGLAISRGLIERMRGKIGFVSEAGQGCRFYFSLPLLPQASECIRV